MGFAHRGVWIMICISLPTKLVDWLSNGILQVMGFHRYGLWVMTGPAVLIEKWEAYPSEMSF